MTQQSKTEQTRTPQPMSRQANAHLPATLRSASPAPDAKAQDAKALESKAQDAKALVDGLIETTSQLVEMMERETAQLQAMKVADIAAGQADKDRLARQFEAKMKVLAADKQRAGTLAPALAGELKAALARFRTAMGANERALRAARDANERVVKAIVDAAQAQAAPRHAYSAAGTLGAPLCNDRMAPPPVALNRQL